MSRTQLLVLGCLAVLAGCGERRAPGGSAVLQNAAGTPAAPPVQVALNNPDMAGLAAQVDTNGDGRMNRQEWQAQGLPETSFNGLEQGRGYVTLKDYRDNAAPPGIDIDGDGKVTIAEFREFDRRMAEKIKKGGAR